MHGRGQHFVPQNIKLLDDAKMLSLLKDGPQTLQIPEQLTNQGPAVGSDRVSPSWDIAAPIHYAFSQARSKLESQLTPLMAPLQFNLRDNRGLKTNALLKAAAHTISSFCCHSEGLHSAPCFFFVASISMPLPMIKCP